MELKSYTATGQPSTDILFKKLRKIPDKNYKNKHFSSLNSIHMPASGHTSKQEPKIRKQSLSKINSSRSGSPCRNVVTCYFIFSISLFLNVRRTEIVFIKFLGMYLFHN